MGVRRMTNTQQKALTGHSKGLIAKLTNFHPATRQVLANDAVLTQLYDLEHVLDYKLGLTDKLLYLDDNISINGELLSTANTIALVLTDNQSNPASIASYIPNSTDRPVITDTSQTCAFVIGDISPDRQLWAIDNLEDGITLYYYLNAIHAQPATVLVSIVNWSYIDMIKHFSQVQTVYTATTLDYKHKLDKLAGDNVKAVITTFDMLFELKADKPLADIMAEATITDMHAHAWGKPEPLATDPSDPTPYPMQAWQGLLQKAIEKIAYYAQVPDAMAGQCVLGALSHMGQRFIDAPIGYQYMPASLILITEGESGSGKTQSIGLSHKEIYNHEKELYKQYSDNLDLWQASKANLKQDELKAFLEDEPRPLNPSSMFKAPTIEPILDKFVNKELINASWTTDDAAQFFNGYTMTSKTSASSLADITDLYSGGEVERERSQKNAYANPHTKAYGVRFTLMLMAQRVILEPALSDPLLNGQGFLARALISMPEDLRGHRVWNDPKRREQKAYADPDLIAYWNRCKQLLAPSSINDPDANDAGRIKMGWHDTQAEQIFYDYMQDIEDRMTKGKQYEFTKAYASRMAENASRIASLIAFFEERYTITIDDIKRAFMLVEYSTSERLRYLDANPSGEQNNSEKLSQWLASKAQGKSPPKLNYSYVYNGAPVPMRKNKPLLINELNILESAGHIRLEIEGKRQVIYINPHLYT